MDRSLLLSCVVLCLGSGSIVARRNLTPLTPDELLEGRVVSAERIAEISKKTGLDQRMAKRVIDFWRKKEALHVPTWRPQYGVVSDLIAQADYKVGCEIGIAFGTQSVDILERTQVEKLYSIDPFVLYHDDMVKGTSSKWWDVLADLVAKRLSAYAPRCEFIRKKSVDVAKQFKDGSLDFVYIDSEHTYRSVLADLGAWYPKVRPGGLLMGDDYTKQFPGLKKGVNAFVRARGLKVTLLRSRIYVMRIPEQKA